MPRALRDNPVLRPGWSRWPRDVGLGFSYKAGDLRADMAPLRGRDRPHVWGAVIWRGTDRESPLWEGGGDHYWDLAEEVAQICLAQDIAGEVIAEEGA